MTSPSGVDSKVKGRSIKNNVVRSTDRVTLRKRASHIGDHEVLGVSTASTLGRRTGTSHFN